MKSFERQNENSELVNTSSFELFVSIFRKGNIKSLFSLSSFFILDIFLPIKMEVKQSL